MSNTSSAIAIESQADLDAVKDFFPELDDISLEPPTKPSTTKSNSRRGGRIGTVATKKQREEQVEVAESVSQLDEVRANTNFDVHKRLDSFVASGGRVEVLQSPQSVLTFLFTIEKNIRFSLCDACIKLYLTDAKKIQPLENGYYLLSLVICPQCAFGNSESKRVYKQAFVKSWPGQQQPQQQQRHPPYYTSGSAGYGGQFGGNGFAQQQHPQQQQSVYTRNY